MDSGFITSIKRSQNLKSKVFFLFKLIVALSLLFYLFTYVQLKNVVETISNSNVSLLLTSLVLLVPNIYLQYLKWRMTCKQLLGENRKRNTFLSLFYGFPPAVFTPGRTGEYIGRGLAFKDRPFMEIILATFVDKFFNVLVTITFGIISSILFMKVYYQTNNFISLPLLIVFSMIVIFAIVIIFSNKDWLYNLTTPLHRFKLLKGIEEKLLILKKLDSGFAIKMFLVSLLFFLCYLLQFMILMIAFSHHYEVWKYFWAANLIMFAKSILSPISISELGIREGASVFFLTKMGESSSTALNASLILFFINIIIPSVIGIFLLFVKNDD